MVSITLMRPYVRSSTLTAILRGRTFARIKEYVMGPGEDEEGDEE